MSKRSELLAAINAKLAERKLKPIHKLGDASKAEIEIVEILEIYEHSARFFTDVKFGVIFPNKQKGAFTVRFNASGATSDDAVFVVFINGKIAVVKQWRLPLGVWTYEMPRGFGEKIDQARINGTLGTIKIGDLPPATLVRELTEEVMQDAEVFSITHLGNIAENSGTHAVVPAFYLVQLRVDDDKLACGLRGFEQDMSVRLWDLAVARKEIGLKLCDCHSVTAVALALRHIESFRG